MELLHKIKKLLKNKEKNLSPTFCVLPWIQQATRTYGSLTPCCVGEPFKDNLNKTTFSKAWNSVDIRELRKTMLKGQQSPLCKRCYDEEKVNIESHRIRSNKFWKDRILFKNLIQQTNKQGFFNGQTLWLDLRLGNKCNLECTMCSPQETIRWESLVDKIYKQSNNLDLKKHLKNHQQFIKSSPSKLWYERESIKKDLYQKIPSVKRITIAGGEPLLIKEHYQFLDECIKQNHSHHISLHYHTNGTVLNRQLFDKWNFFESVIIFISLDDIGERNRYIRYPCSWKRIETNLEMISKFTPKNVRPIILCTLQIKNIFYFDEFLYYLTQKFNKILSYYDDCVHTEVVHHPYFLSCQVLPKKVKDIISKKFEKIYKKYPAQSHRFQTLIQFMNAEDKSKFLPVFKDYIKSLDKARGTDFQKTFPELWSLL